MSGRTVEAMMQQSRSNIQCKDGAAGWLGWSRIPAHSGS